uniref:Reverse transcriptase domain-containing protein n=1 Tax=Tanacetum cinerariifolium TaxID=118510 RepID=A0A6L2MI29_TANCI|nr:reverse transcriptase domain-containing protein [Tanacetum cinerariifolium]
MKKHGDITPYPRKDTFTPLIKTPKEILAMESLSSPEPPPLIETPEKHNLNKSCDYHEDRGHNTNKCYQLKKQIEGAVALGKGSRKRPFEGERFGLTDELTFQVIPQNQLTDEPIILEGIIECHYVRRIIVDGGSSSEIMYKHCFRSLNVNIQSRLRRCRTLQVGFLGETYHPLGIIDLRVTMGKAERNKTLLMDFAIIKCRSSYNVIIGRTEMRILRAVFTWAGSERTAVPSFIMEHQLKIYPLAEPVVHKRRPLISDGRQELKERAFSWLKEGTIRKEAKGSVVKKFFGQGEQVQKTPGANEGETSNLNKELQVKLILTLRAWRLYLGKETIEEGSGVGIILVSLDEKMHLYAIHLKFNADHAMDCETLLAGLVDFVNKDMKDLYVFIDSLTLVAQIEGNHTPTTEHERKYKEEIMDATTPFHRFWITYLPKILNSKVEMLTGLVTIKLEFLNQEVSIGIKTRPSMDEISSRKREKAANNVPRTKPNYN